MPAASSNKCFHQPAHLVSFDAYGTNFSAKSLAKPPKSCNFANQIVQAS